MNQSYQDDADAPTAVNPVVAVDQQLGLAYRSARAELNVELPGAQNIKVAPTVEVRVGARVLQKARSAHWFPRIFSGARKVFNEIDPGAEQLTILLRARGLMDFCHAFLNGAALLVCRGNFIAAAMDVRIEADASFGKLDLLRCSGTGSVFLGAAKKIREVAIEGNYEEALCNIVAFSDGMHCEFGRIDNQPSMIFAGKGHAWVWDAW